MRVSKVFGDHMAVQQNQPVRVWGLADPGEDVTVALAGKHGTAKAGADGRWRIDLPSMKADGKAHIMTIKGNNTVTLKDVLLGEVWICSGQSNMEWQVQGSMNAKEEIATANHPKIRLFDVPGHVAGTQPQDDPRGQWQGCSGPLYKGMKKEGDIHHGLSTGQPTGGQPRTVKLSCEKIFCPDPLAAAVVRR